MIFYKVTVKFKMLENVQEMEFFVNEKITKKFADASKKMIELTTSKAIGFIQEIAPECDAYFYFSDNQQDYARIINDYFKNIDDEYICGEIEETTLSDFVEALDEVDKALKNEIIEATGLQSFATRRGTFYFSEKIVTEHIDKSTIDNNIEKQYLCKEYAREMDRIYNRPKETNFIGHPVHYILVSKDFTKRKTMIRSLVSSLYDKGRLTTKRYSIVRTGYVDVEELENLYLASDGATVVIKFEPEDVEEELFQRKNDDFSGLCELVKKYCSRTLTIFSVDHCADDVKDKIYNNLAGVSLCYMADDTYSTIDVEKVFLSLGEHDKLTVPQDLIDKYKTSGKSYEHGELLRYYNAWKHNYLSTEVFPEYKEFVTEDKAIVDQDTTNAYKELQEMIGLGSVKQVLDKALNYFRMQKEYRNRGIAFKRPALNMVFTGSPGTAKTSVARLIARILRDEGVLTKGALVEVGRADLVGKYVGHTAPLVKRAFKKAEGSILFIDEAYSLVEDKAGMYGDEAINTIVQEMENNRNNTIVIFAGYEDKMQEFIARNPGLRSRIGFHIKFDDYDAEELYSITELIAKNTGFKLDKDVKPKLIQQFDKIRGARDFGNGRYARNLIERAKLNQASRLVGKQLQFVTDEELTTLKAEDFEIEEVKIKPNRLGFGNE